MSAVTTQTKKIQMSKNKAKTKQNKRIKNPKKNQNKKTKKKKKKKKKTIKKPQQTNKYYLHIVYFLRHMLLLELCGLVTCYEISN